MHDSDCSRDESEIETREEHWIEELHHRNEEQTCCVTRIYNKNLKNNRWKHTIVQVPVYCAWQHTFSRGTKRRVCKAKHDIVWKSSTNWLNCQHSENRNVDKNTIAEIALWKIHVQSYKYIFKLYRMHIQFVNIAKKLITLLKNDLVDGLKRKTTAATWSHRNGRAKDSRRGIVIDTLVVSVLKQVFKIQPILRA